MERLVMRGPICRAWCSVSEFDDSGGRSPASLKTPVLAFVVRIGDR